MPAFAPSHDWDSDLQEYLQAVFGVERFRTIAAALMRPPLSTCLRVNTLRTTPEVCCFSLSTFPHSVAQVLVYLPAVYIAISELYTPAPACQAYDMHVVRHDATCMWCISRSQAWNSSTAVVATAQTTVITRRFMITKNTFQLSNMRQRIHVVLNGRKDGLS